MKKDKLEAILSEYMKALDIKERIRLELKPMKIKAASISLTKRVIRINKNIIPLIGEDSLRYLILHEIIHYKIGSIYHTNNFHKYVSKWFEDEEIKSFEKEIIRALVAINGVKNIRYRLDDG